MNRTELEHALEQHVQECLSELERFKEVQNRYATARKALLVFRGQTMGGEERKKAKVAKAGGGWNGAHARAEQARQILAEYLPQKKGLTIKDMVGICNEHGLAVDSNIVHNALRQFRLLGVLTDVGKVGTAILYRIKGK